MKILKILILILLFAACDIVPDADRTLQMDEIVPLRKALLLDFTDQECPNCPKAGKEVDRLKEYYGADLVSVTIHGSYNTKLPLVTADGNKYDLYFNTREEGHPSGIIDGKFVLEYEAWAGVVLEHFKVFPEVNISLSAAINDSILTVESRLETVGKIKNPKLLLWVVEDSVASKQVWETETIPDYLHRRIFRASVNSTWGEEIDASQTGEITKNHSYVLDRNWNKLHISVVAFVFDNVSDYVYGVNEVKVE